MQLKRQCHQALPLVISYTLLLHLKTVQLVFPLILFELVAGDSFLLTDINDLSFKVRICVAAKVDGTGCDHIHQCSFSFLVPGITTCTVILKYSPFFLVAPVPRFNQHSCSKDAHKKCLCSSLCQLHKLLLHPSPLVTCHQDQIAEVQKL